MTGTCLIHKLYNIIWHIGVFFKMVLLLNIEVTLTEVSYIDHLFHCTDLKF